MRRRIILMGLGLALTTTVGADMLRPGYYLTRTVTSENMENSRFFGARLSFDEAPSRLEENPLLLRVLDDQRTAYLWAVGEEMETASIDYAGERIRLGNDAQGLQWLSPERFQIVWRRDGIAARVALEMQWVDEDEPALGRAKARLGVTDEE